MIQSSKNEHTQTFTIALPGAEMVSEALNYLINAKEYRVDSDLMLLVAGEDLINVKAKLTALHEQRMSITRPLDAAKDGVMNLFRPAVQYLTDAEDILKRAITNYHERERHTRRIEENKRRDAVRAEQERLTREAAERERAAQVEAMRLRASALAMAAEGNQVAAAELVTQAHNAEIAGAQEAQETLQHASELLPVPVAAPLRIPGINPRATWHARVDDLMELVHAISRGDASLAYVVAAEPVLNAVASRLQAEFNVPGCSAVVDRSVSATRRG